MTLDETRDYLDTLPLADALWWFIENVYADQAGRTSLFFYLRERMRQQQQTQPLQVKP